MLQAIRDRAQGWIAGLIIGLIVLVFSLWGVQSYFEAIDPSGLIVKVEYPKGSWFGEEAELNQLEYSLFARQNRNNPMFLEQSVKPRLLMDTVAKYAGLRVGQQMVDDNIRRNFTQEGQFNVSAYEQAVRSFTSRRWSFEEVNRFDIRVFLLMSPINGGGFALDKDLQRYVALSRQSRNIGYAVVKKDRFMDQVEVSEEEIQTYFDKNKERYKTPEKLTVAFLELDMNKLAENIPPPSDAELKERYEAFKLAYHVPEERRAGLIQFDISDGENAEEQARQKAQEVYEKLDNGADFSDMAKQHSDDPSADDGGEIGFISETTEGLDAAFKQELFSLEEGAYSKPIKTSFGYQIVKAIEVRKGDVPQFDKVKDQLVEEYKLEKAEEEFDIRREELARETFEDRNTLENAAKSFGLERKVIGPFERNKPVGIAKESEVRKALREEDILKGINSDPIEVSEKKVVFIRVVERAMPKQKELDMVKEDIAKQLKREKAEDKAKALAESLLESMKKGEKPEALAQSKGLEWKTEEQLKRDDGKFDSALRRNIFKMPKPESKEKPALDVISLFSGDHAVVALYGITDGTLDGLEKEQVDQNRQRINFYWSGTESEAFLRSLENNAAIEMYPDRI